MPVGLSHRVSICQLSSLRWSFLEDVSRYHSHGFNTLSIWRPKLEDIGIEAASDLLRGRQMEVSSLHCTSGFTGDGQPFKNAIEDTIQAIQEARQIGADLLIVHPGSRNLHTNKNLLKLFRLALDELIPVAADYGVRLGFEPAIENKRCTFLSSFSETLEILNSYNREHWGLVLDLYEFGLCQETLRKLNSWIDSLALVQLSDRSKDSTKEADFRLPLGQGNVDILAWLRKLQSTGYQGHFEIEILGGLAQRDYFDFLDQTADFFDQSLIRTAAQPVLKTVKPTWARSNS